MQKSKPKVAPVLNAALAALFIQAVHAAPVTPPAGSVAVTLKEPVWISSIAGPNVHALTGLPEPAYSEHMTVTKAGFWIMNKDKPSQVYYEFAVKVDRPFNNAVNTRFVLTDPTRPKAPIKIDRVLALTDKTASIVQGPIKGLVKGTKYTLSLEVYWDKARRKRLERLTQDVTAPFGIDGGCVVLPDDLKKTVLTDTGGAPLDKAVLACDR